MNYFAANVCKRVYVGIASKYQVRCLLVTTKKKGIMLKGSDLA